MQTELFATFLVSPENVLSFIVAGDIIGHMDKCESSIGFSGCRYSVEKIPLYDSADDEPSAKHLRTAEPMPVDIRLGSEPQKESNSVVLESEPQKEPGSVMLGSQPQKESHDLPVESLDIVPMEDAVPIAVKFETEGAEEIELHLQDSQQAFPQNSTMISRVRNNSGCRNHQTGPGIPKKKAKHLSNGKLKNVAQKKVDPKYVVQFLTSKEAQEEVLKFEVSSCA